MGLEIQGWCASPKAFINFQPTLSDKTREGWGNHRRKLNQKGWASPRFCVKLGLAQNKKGPPSGMMVGMKKTKRKMNEKAALFGVSIVVSTPFTQAPCSQGR